MLPVPPASQSGSGTVSSPTCLAGTAAVSAPASGSGSVSAAFSGSRVAPSPAVSPAVVCSDSSPPSSGADTCPFSSLPWSAVVPAGRPFSPDFPQGSASAALSGSSVAPSGAGSPASGTDHCDHSQNPVSFHSAHYTLLYLVILTTVSICINRSPRKIRSTIAAVRESWLFF